MNKKAVTYWKRDAYSTADIIDYLVSTSGQCTCGLLVVLGLDYGSLVHNSMFWGLFLGLQPSRTVARRSSRVIPANTTSGFVVPQITIECSLYIQALSLNKCIDSISLYRASLITHPILQLLTSCVASTWDRVAKHYNQNGENEVFCVK